MSKGGTADVPLRKQLETAERKYTIRAKSATVRMLKATTDRYGLSASIPQIEAAETEYYESIDRIILAAYKSGYRLGCRMACQELEKMGLGTTLEPVGDPIIVDQLGNRATMREFLDQCMASFKDGEQDPALKKRMNTATEKAIVTLIHEAFQKGHDWVWDEARKWAGMAVSVAEEVECSSSSSSPSDLSSAQSLLQSKLLSKWQSKQP